jgi:MarR family transcriptional regulator for hemolysin
MRIAETARRWRQLLDDRLRDTGLSQARWLALLHLHRLGDGVSQITLAQSIGIEGASLVRILDDLESRGLVERHIDPQDRRAKRLVLTPEGTLAMQEVDAIADALRAELLDGLDDSALAHLLYAIDRILTNAARATARHRPPATRDRAP